jgi:sugar lactone lactonase YvrE
MSKNADKVFFVGKNAQNVSGIYRTGPHGGSVQTVTRASDVCNPCTFKRSIVISNDDKKLFTIAARNNECTIVAINETTGAARLLGSTTSYNAHGLAAGLNGYIYFTGSHNSKQGLFRVRDDGSDIRVIAIGGAFTFPDGVVLNAANTVAYVTDSGRLLRVNLETGAVHTLLRGLTLGNPAGLAVSLDATQILMSAVDATGHCEVKVFDGEAGSLTSFNDVIGQNTQCGGVHRAYSKDQFAWADLAGNVFIIRTRISL